ncbi:BspA family leucine-rich repeat surface protein [Campylobacter jejuni]
MSSRSVTNIIDISIDENYNKNISGNSFFSLYGQIGYNVLIGVKTLAGDEFWEKYPQYKNFVEKNFIEHSNTLNQVDYEGSADAIFYKKNNKIFACVKCGVEEDNSSISSSNIFFDEKFIKETSSINPLSQFEDIRLSREAVVPIDKYIEYKYTEKPNEINGLIREIVDNFVEFYKVEPIQPDFDFSKFDNVLNQILMPKYFPETKEELQALVEDQSIYLGDIDTSKITDMSYLFENSTRTDFSGIEKWDVSSVRDMTGMFENCTSFNQDISSWDVSGVKDMSFMFLDCYAFNQDLSSWDVRNIEDMSCMFLGCKTFNQPLGDWDVSKVENMSWMFENCTSFNQDISSWNVGRVVNMKSMFKGCHSFNQDLSSWDISNVKNMEDMFENCPIDNLNMPSQEQSSIKRQRL